MKTILSFIATLVTVASFGQTFEGKIVYKNTYKATEPTKIDWNSFFGTKQEYFIKDGDYKTVSNGSFEQGRLYVRKENKIYNEFANDKTLIWWDAANNNDSVLKAEITKGVTTILGYQCDELILTCRSGVQKYYFNSSLSVDPALFANHKFGNWSEYFSRTKSVPLKMVLQTKQFTLERTATQVKSMKIDKALMGFPAKTKLMKGPLTQI
jgi:hypothetical protein